MARATLRGPAIAAIVVTVAGCGGAPPIDRPQDFVLGDGWTETPLDAELTRLACGPGTDCGDVCRVHAHVTEPSGGTRDVEHRMRPGARLVVTERSDGSLSLHATIDRDEGRLLAVLELEHRGAVHADAAIRALARPGSGGLAEGARVTRTYERFGEAPYVLHEVGGAVRRARYERQEELEGTVHRGRVRAARYSADTRASVDGRVRSIESLQVRGDDRSRSSVVEQLDERGRVVRTLRRIDPPWTGGEGTQESELEYDGDDDVPSALTRWWEGEPRRRELATQGLSEGWEIERDEQGRTTYRFRSDEAEGDGVITIARDAAGRITSISGHTRSGNASVLEIARDERGRVVGETATWTGREGAEWTRTFARTFDGAGRVVRMESIVRARESEEMSSTTATYEIGDHCPPDVVVPDELDLLPTLDDRVDYVP